MADFDTLDEKLDRILYNQALLSLQLKSLDAGSKPAREAVRLEVQRQHEAYISRGELDQPSRSGGVAC